jgi:hypothetical protein
MAAITHPHHHFHVPAPVSRTAHGAEKLLAVTVFTLLPWVAFGLLIVSGLLLAMAVSKIL